MNSNYPKWLPEAIQLLNTGISKRAVARELDIGRTCCRQWLNKYEDGDVIIDENDTNYIGSFIDDFSKPKVLLFDIESSLILGYFFSPFKPVIPISCIKEDWYVLCWSARWLGEDTILNASVHDHPKVDGRFKNNEEYVVRELWKLLDEADVVCAYNGKKFDKKKMNFKFLEYGLPEPSPYKLTDPYLTVRGNFAPTSGKMDFIAKYVNDREKEFKHDTNMQLWVDCMNDDIFALQRMQDYCDQDIEVLEKVYMLVRAWDKNHPNMALYYKDDKVRCNVCGSDELTVIEGKTDNTNVSKFQLVQCNNCQANLSERVNLLSKSKRQSLLRKAR